MSDEQRRDLSHDLEQVTKLVQLLKLLAGIGFSLATAIAAVAVWVSQVNAAQTQNSKDITNLVTERKASLESWSTWRASKDETDTRLIEIIKAQTAALERIERRQDRP